MEVSQAILANPENDCGQAVEEGSQAMALAYEMNDKCGSLVSPPV